MIGRDYRGVQVLAAWRAVPGSTWSLVGKVDLAEVEKPVRELAFASLLLAVALGVASTLFLVLRLRQLAGHAHAAQEALVSHYGYLARYANDIILLLDAKGNIVEANDRAVEAYGYDRRELLAFSEQQHLAGDPLDLNALLQFSGDLLRRALGERIQLQLEPYREPLLIRGDVELLRLVLTNLADNARQAMPHGGRFTVAATPKDSGEPAAEAGSACLRVADTGSGMTEEVRNRLFEPFFTTQGFGKGAGLGLPMVFGIVCQHGGRMEVISAPGKGAEFRIFLPLAGSARKE